MKLKKEEYVLPEIKQTILRNKLRDEVIPYNNDEELFLLLPKWEEFIYEAILSYIEENEDEVIRFKQEVRLEFEIQRSDFVNETDIMEDIIIN